MNGNLENGHGGPALKKQRTIAEQAAADRLSARVLPENRQERMAYLLKNLPNEDLVYIDNSRIPAFLRIDKDVQVAREKLEGYQDQYMSFNIPDYT